MFELILDIVFIVLILIHHISGLIIIIGGIILLLKKKFISIKGVTFFEILVSRDTTTVVLFGTKIIASMLAMMNSEPIFMSIHVGLMCAYSLKIVSNTVKVLKS